jgi:hypothetical protein
MAENQAIKTSESPGLRLWRLISSKESYRDLPPLARFIQYVRDTSHTRQELLKLSFTLCEANLQITALEFNHWQGLAVIDATGVFSAQGLGQDLCSRYGLDFQEFLKTLGKLASDSEKPSQYHQCINQNLFSSPFNDDVMMSRLESLSSFDSATCLGWIPVSSPELQRLNSGVRTKEGTAHHENCFRIEPQQNPHAYGGYGRSLRWSMDGNIVIKSPFCCNAWLDINGSKLLHWLCSVDLKSWHEAWVDAQEGEGAGELELEYQCDLCEHRTMQLRLLASIEAPGYEEPGRAPVHYWMHQTVLPLKATNHIAIKLDTKAWKSLKGADSVAYGYKCLPEKAALLHQHAPRLILALEGADQTHIPQGRLSLPRIRWWKNDQRSSLRTDVQ